MGLLWILFTDYAGRKTYIATKGKSTFYRRGEAQICAYYLGFRHTIIHTPDGHWVVCFKIYLRIVDARGIPLEPKAAHTRRKAVVRSWWNNKLLNRYLAICAAIQAFQGLRRFCEPPEQVLLDSELITFAAPFGIDERRFDRTGGEDEPADDGSNVSAELSPVDDEAEEGNEL